MVRFTASYPAALLYVLDASADPLYGRQRAEEYRSWVLADGPQPAWHQAYASHRRAWGAAHRSRAVSQFEACFWEANDLDGALRCVDGVVPAQDRPIAREAFRQADLTVRPRWNEFAPYTLSLMPELERRLQSPVAADLFRILRHESGLADDVALTFNVVLFPTPPRAVTHAQQRDQFLLAEVRDGETAGDLLSKAFHEVAHLSHALSPRRHAMDQRFVSLGDSGRFAANAWDEIVATAFGNGLAAERLDPAFDVHKEFYHDPFLDRIGRALWSEWRAGRDVQLGPELADHLVQLIDRDWPADQRPMSRYLWYVTVYMRDVNDIVPMLTGVMTRSLFGDAPIPDAVPAAPGDRPPWMPRIVVITASDLASRPALLARAGIPPRSWEPVLAASPAAVFRHDDADGTWVFVIVAPDDESLRSGGRRFVNWPAMVQPGWTPLPAQGPSLAAGVDEHIPQQP